MSTKLKRIKSILDNPKSVSFNDIKIILENFGYSGEQPSRGSSHYIFRKEGCYSITVPKKHPYVKEHYIKEIILLLELEDWYEENS